jgi:hypothetical protein
MPFLPVGQPAAFGLRLSSDGFQRAVRNPAIRRLARDRLSSRLIDRFVRDAYVKRGGTGPITKQDREDGKNLLCAYLDTPQGLSDLANETPAPVGSGKLRQRVAPVPDPFSDFDIEVPELDLWLGNDRIEGRARVTGEGCRRAGVAVCRSHLRHRGRSAGLQFCAKRATSHRGTASRDGLGRRRGWLRMGLRGRAEPDLAIARSITGDRGRCAASAGYSAFKRGVSRGVVRAELHGCFCLLDRGCRTLLRLCGLLGMPDGGTCRAIGVTMRTRPKRAGSPPAFHWWP